MRHTLKLNDRRAGPDVTLAALVRAAQNWRMLGCKRVARQHQLRSLLLPYRTSMFRRVISRCAILPVTLVSLGRATARLSEKQMNHMRLGYCLPT